jgi:hypothetical protein
MFRRTLLMATAIITSSVITACSDATAPKDLAPGGLSAASSPRSGLLHVEKDCSSYLGNAGEFCTITSSSLKQIEPGSRITYISGAVGPLLDTDVVLDLPRPGNNHAFGHCTVNLATVVGGCVFSSGTGKFTHFHASVALSHLDGFIFAWNGTYSFNPHD